MTAVYYRTYATKDAAIAVACVSNGLRRRFLAATGMDDLALADGQVSPDAPAEHYESLKHAMEARIAQRTTAEWKQAFDAHGVPASPVYLPFELLEDEQTVANGIVHDVSHPVLGPVRVLATPVELDGEGFRTCQPTAPFGSETRALLAELGLTTAEAEACIVEGAVVETEAER